MARLALWAGAAAAALALVRSRSARADSPAPARSTAPRDLKTAQPAPPSDRLWEPAYLTEYHPDAPASQRRLEGGRYDRYPGGEKHPVVRWEQHAADPARYPFVTVSGDLVLRGKPVPYGARLHLEAYPRVTFRLFDTGGHFFGPDKVYHGYSKWVAGTSYKKGAGVQYAGLLYRAAETVPGSSTPPGTDLRWIAEPRPYPEPFDLATSYHRPEQKGLGLSGTRTRYWVDFDDVVAYPAWLAVKPQAVA